MDDTGHARLTDFGLAGVASDSGPVASETKGHSVRWAAPEVLATERPVSKESDVYSFAMVVIEVRACGPTLIERAAHRYTYKAITGKVPFHNSIPATVVVDVVSGGRPDRPADPCLTDDLWDLTKHCWDHDPQRRPEISEVVLSLLTLFVHAELDGTTLGSVRQGEMASGEFSFIPSSKATLSEVGRIMLPTLLVSGCVLQTSMAMEARQVVPFPTCSLHLQRPISQR